MRQRLHRMLLVIAAAVATAAPAWAAGTSLQLYPEKDPHTGQGWLAGYYESCTIGYNNNLDLYFNAPVGNITFKAKKLSSNSASELQIHYETYDNAGGHVWQHLTTFNLTTTEQEFTITNLHRNAKAIAFVFSDGSKRSVTNEAVVSEIKMELGKHIYIPHKDIDFGSVAVGMSATQPLHISSVYYDQDVVLSLNDTCFHFDNGGQELRLAAGYYFNNQNINITFAPNEKHKSLRNLLYIRNGETDSVYLLGHTEGCGSLRLLLYETTDKSVYTLPDSMVRNGYPYDRIEVTLVPNNPYDYAETDVTVTPCGGAPVTKTLRWEKMETEEKTLRFPFANGCTSFTIEYHNNNNNNNARLVDVTVPQSEYVRGLVRTLDFGTVTLGDSAVMMFPFEYSAMGEMITGYISDNQMFEIGGALETDGCGSFAQAEGPVKFVPTAEGPQIGHLVVDGGYAMDNILLTGVGQKRPQAITFTDNLSQLAKGQVVQLTATAGSKLPVTYEVADPSVATIITDANGNVTIQASDNGGGTTTVTARQDGDNIWAAAEPVSLQLSIMKKDETTTRYCVSSEYMTSVSYDWGTELNTSYTTELLSCPTADTTEFNCVIDVAGITDAGRPGTVTLSAIVRGKQEVIATRTFTAAGTETIKDVKLMPRVSGIVATFDNIDASVHNNNNPYIEKTYHQGDVMLPMAALYRDIFDRNEMTEVTFDDNPAFIADGKNEQTKDLQLHYTNIPDGIDFYFEGESPAFSTNTKLYATSCSNGLPEYANFKLTFRPETPGKHTAVLVFQAIINDSVYNEKIPVTAYAYAGQAINFMEDYTKMTTVDRNVPIRATSTSGGAITYTSSDPDVVEINEIDGEPHIYIHKIGQATLTAHMAAEGYYSASDTTIHVDASRGTMEFIGTYNKECENQSNWLPLCRHISKEQIPLSDFDSLNILFSAEATLGTKTSCWDVSFGNRGSLTILPDGALRVDGEITNPDANSLTLQTNGFGQGAIAFHGAAPMATVELMPRASSERAPEGAADPHANPLWQYLGTAVHEYAIPATDNNGTVIFEWDETLATGDESWKRVSKMVPWNGYALTQFEAGRKLHTRGLLQNGDHTYRLTYTDGGRESGNNLVTNSYSAPIDISALEDGDFVGAERTIYIYNTGSVADWESGINSGDNSMPGTFHAIPIHVAGSMDFNDTHIPMQQAFFVRAEKGAANAQFTVNYDRAVFRPYTNNYQLRSFDTDGGEERLNRLAVRVLSNRYSDQVYLFEHEGCTDGFDNGYDGRKDITAGAPQLYATNMGARGAERYSVSTGKDICRMTLGFRGAVAEEGDYRLTFDLSRLEGYDELYLVDSVENRTHDILSGAAYDFRADGSRVDNRFGITGVRSDVIAGVDNGEGAGAREMIVVAGSRATVDQSLIGSEVVITDAAGRTVYTSTISAAEIELPVMPAGVYFITAGGCTAKFAR